ncbi:hypothetical protein A9G33_00370 [Gilliamella sp. Choc3-5]|jgi:hypothetical protein|uniref:hypothetical protein n=1 Tax=Gilliamella sp. Choc3-5 TaxID=3120236 RepID=UPI00080E58A0|nr:hypothetical protein [Gilliamella apicola]OCG30435.1 hypothetical protein A9G33_00370 [Gilliamella apicola]
MKTIKQITSFLILIFLFISHNPAIAGLNKNDQNIRETPLPFDFRLWDKAERGISNDGYFFDHAKIDYQFTDNMKLFTYFVKDNFVLSNYYKEKNLHLNDAIYIKLETKKPFDVFIIKSLDDFILLNISPEGEILSTQKIATIINDNQWRTFTIDKSLKIKSTTEIVRYSEVNAMYLRNRKLTEQIFQILDDGKIKSISDKQFPNIDTDYNPANSDNCFQKIASFSDDRVQLDSPLELPINSDDFDYITDSFEPEGKGNETYCQTLAGNYVRLPNANQNYVYFFTGHDDVGWKVNEKSKSYYGIGYLVTVRDHQVKDMLPVYYHSPNNNQKVEFAINKNMSIELFITEDFGKKVKHNFFINKNGEFE